jgi:hypothetical protein
MAFDAVCHGGKCIFLQICGGSYVFLQNRDEKYKKKFGKTVEK